MTGERKRKRKRQREKRRVRKGVREREWSDGGRGRGAGKRNGLFIGLWETDPPQGQLAKYKTEVALSVYGLDGERRLSPLLSAI